MNARQVLKLSLDASEAIAYALRHDPPRAIVLSINQTANALIQELRKVADDDTLQPQIRAEASTMRAVLRPLAMESCATYEASAPQ